MQPFRYLFATNLAACLLVSISIASTLAQNAPAKAEVRNVSDEYFGQKITDPYRWLEDLKAGETQRWIKSQADYSRAYLDKMPMRGEILERLNGLSGASVNISGVRPLGNLYFYLKRNPGEPDNKLYVREGLTSAERLLIDPTKVIDGGKRYSLGGWNISWDGKYVSYLIYAGGSEVGEIRVVETATGKDMGERIEPGEFQRRRMAA